MKTMLLSILTIITISVHAQDLPTKEGKVFYESVDTATGTKAELYNNAKRWIAQTFNDAKTVIELDDKENGEIIGKCGVLVNWNPLGAVQRSDRCKMTLQVNVKDNKYRIQLYDLSIQDMSATYNRPIEDYQNKGAGKKLLPVVNKNITDLLKDFAAAMQTKHTNDF